MNEIQLHRLDLNLLVVFEALMRERSVTRAADTLGKTPSAVSHALGRLREQVGDPLMVKVGGVMQPSPFALELIDEVRPILRNIQRVVRAPQAFDPATSHRVFRLAVPAFTALIAEVSARVYAQAPDVGLEWLSPSPQTYPQVLDGQVDLGMLSADTPLSDGISEQVIPPLVRYTFARRGHPATGHWTREAWLHWPHVLVGMAGAARQTVEERVAALGIERRVGARIPDFSGVGPLLARTNMLANQALAILADDMDLYGLEILEPPVPLPPITMRLFWSTRLGNDPGSRWIREAVIASFRDLLMRADERMKTTPLIRAQVA